MKTVVGKQFPARSIQQTLNPRLNVEKKGEGAKPKGRGKATTVNDNKTINPCDENPFFPLETLAEKAEINDNSRKSFGRGRGRRAAASSTTRPGSNVMQPPPKENSGGARPKSVPKDRTPDVQADSTASKDNDSKYTNEISTSWYDEEDDQAEQSLSTEAGLHDNSYWVDGEDDTSDHSEQSQEDEDIEILNIDMPKVTRNASRKRTSTKEAPVDFLSQSMNRGKSTAPANKKPKIDNNTGKGKKGSYVDVLNRNRWPQVGGNNKKRSNLRNKKMPELKSAAEAALKEVYIQELDCSTCNGSDKFEYMVLEYCRKRGINAVDACTIPVKGNRLKSGCKLTVHQADYDAAMVRDFWPRGARVRPWKQRPRNLSNDDDDDDEDSHTE